MHVFHREIGTTLRGSARIEHACNVRVVHHRQRLTFRLEARDHFARVHSGLDHLERDLTSDRLLLLRQPHFTHAAVPDGPQQAIRSDQRRRRDRSGPNGVWFARGSGIGINRSAHGNINGRGHVKGTSSATPDISARPR